MARPNQIIYTVNAHTLTDSSYAHTASTIENAAKWVTKHGSDWENEPYCFFAYPITVDKDEVMDNGIDDAVYITLDGRVTKNNPLY